MGRGISLRSISISTGISRATLHDWREHPEISVSPRAVCSRCVDNPTLPEPQALRLCGETLDQLGVAWRFSRRNAISVARREAVERLDQFVGPKY